MKPKRQKPIEIRVGLVQENTVILTYLQRDSIFMDPPYQRDSEIWSKDKMQLLIDSIINGFDIPKFYLHEYEKPRMIKGRSYKYALIDGKQRLQAIWDFINNELPLSDDIEYLRDPSAVLKGLTYSELGKDHPFISAYFDGRPLSLMAVRTDDTELIEEMFSRLNEAMPLNAPEKRNALGGPLPPIIRKLIATKFFIASLPFTNKRYRHLDLACKFLYLLNVGGATDTKKTRLDGFVREFKEEQLRSKAKQLEAESRTVLKAMADVFVKKDLLLKNTGIVVVYFLLFRQAIKLRKLGILRRSKFLAFEELREENRRVAEADIEKADYDLIRFEELANSLNDKFAIKFRYDTICKHVFPQLAVED
jgi:Protein of unknown function DUF262